jgi:hypothetical protein
MCIRRQHRAVELLCTQTGTGWKGYACNAVVKQHSRSAGTQWPGQHMFILTLQLI